MGRRANWFRAVKRALHSECKEQHKERSTKPKRKWFMKKAKKKRSAHPIVEASTTTVEKTTPMPLPSIAVEAAEQIPAIPCDKVRLKEQGEEEEEERKRHAESIAVATAKATEAAAAAAQAAAEVVRLTNIAASSPPRKPKEDVAALRIQAAFRAYLARRALCALRGLATLNIVMQGKCIKRPASNTLISMQSLVRMQSRVRTKRLSLSEDNQGRRMGHTLEKQVNSNVLEKNLPQNGHDWNARPKSKEQTEARVQSQHEVATTRERTPPVHSLNHHHQKSRRNSLSFKSTQTVLTEIKNQHSGWSWLERWLAARPWEAPNSIPDAEAGASTDHDGHNRQGSSVDDEDDDYCETCATSSLAPAHTHTLPSSMASANKAPDDSKTEATDRLSVCSAKKTRSRRSVSTADANNIAEHQTFVNAL